MNKLPEWYGNVYHESLFPKSEHDYWNRVKEFVIDRDGSRCQACSKKGRTKFLTVHHIIPRIEGGNDELNNLITLHYACHDYVEAQGFRLFSEIVNCTVGMDEKELRSYVSDKDIPERIKPAIDLPEAKRDRADIVCPCGIHHIRKASQIGTEITLVNCSCGRKAIYENGSWNWMEPMKPNLPKAPEPEKKQPSKKIYSYSFVTCPICNINIMYWKPMRYSGIRCSGCNSEAYIINGKFWWNVLLLADQWDEYKEEKLKGKNKDHKSSRKTSSRTNRR
ncbi:MAG TPA: HNH endonuclease signature motif containing protein [Thermoguttaceae bacterium]